MRKVAKVVALVLALVMILTVFAGCALFGRDMAKYRDQVVLKVGEERITVGQIMDVVNNYYYNYSSYISSGSITMNDIFSMAMDSIYSTYSKVDDYKGQEGVKIYTDAENKYIGTLASNDYYMLNYISQAETEFILQSVKYSLFTSFDAEVNSYITAEIGSMAEESADDERAFYEYDDMHGAKTYAEKLYLDNFVNEDMTEYFDTYYGFAGFDRNTANIDNYVFQTAEQAQARVDYINKQLKKYVIDDKGEQDTYPTITAEQYIQYQKTAVKKLSASVDNTYGAGIQTYFDAQVEARIVNTVALKWDLQVNSQLEKDQTALIKALQQRYDSAKGNAQTAFNINPDSYITFVEGLTDTSYIYDIPATYQGDYIYVKNLLIPFTDKQKAQLSNLATILGSTTSAEYIAEREKLAASIVAKDFNNDEAEVEGLFKYTEGSGLQLSGELASELPVGGTVTPEKFEELMARFNTDTAQHSAMYDYVVRIGETPANYTAKWVQEFVDAANKAYKAGKQHYSIAVSEYGVHIVYYSGDVEAWNASFTAENIYNPTTNEYRFMKSYYNDAIKAIQEKATETLEDTYKYGGKIEIISNTFYELMADYGISYDFNEAMTKPEEDEEQK